MNTVLCDPLPVEKPLKRGEVLSAFPVVHQSQQVEFRNASKSLLDKEIYTPSPISNYSYRILIFPDQVQTDKIKLKKPLPVVIEKADKFFSIYNDELNISDLGESKKEAVNNFIDFLVKDYLTYKNTPEEKLSEGAKKLLLTYRNWVEDK